MKSELRPSLRLKVTVNCSASLAVYFLGLRSSANNAGFFQIVLPSVRQKIDKAHRGSCSPGYHLPWPKCKNPPSPYWALNLCTNSVANPLLVGPRASVFHSGASLSAVATKVGSPPMVSRTSPAASFLSTSLPNSMTAAHAVSS